MIMASSDKLTELVLYIGATCALDRYYGVLKLNKMLFYSDFGAYRVLGESITGVEYRKYDHGPAPAGMKAFKARLVEANDAYEYLNPMPMLNEDGEDIREKRLLPRRAPNMSLFAPEQVALVDQVMTWLRPFSGTKVSLMSHEHPGWKLAKLEDEIPYLTALVPKNLGRAASLSANDRRRAIDLANSFGAGQISF
jgi:hypothetical protein